MRTLLFLLLAPLFGWGQTSIYSDTSSTHWNRIGFYQPVNRLSLMMEGKTVAYRIIDSPWVFIDADGTKRVVDSMAKMKMGWEPFKKKPDTTAITATYDSLCLCYEMRSPKEVWWVDTTYGYILAQTCEQCQAIYRPVISVRNVNKVRYWRRQWVFGKIQYYYKPIPESWKVIDYKRSEKW